MKENTSPEAPYFIRIAVLITLFWTVVLGSLLAWSILDEKKQGADLAKSQTRAFFQDFLMARMWNTFHGGVYVQVTEDTPPNPHLRDDPHRDLETFAGITLTKLNPAYMTRQMADLSGTASLVHFHLTGIDPINPQNAPEPWELRALQNLGEKKEYFELFSLENGNKVFRYLSPLIIDTNCLNCHEKYGEKEGQQYGGISVTIPAAPILLSQQKQIVRLALSYFCIWCLGVFFIWSFTSRLAKNFQERMQIIQKLHEYLKEIKILSGMLPICCSCKNIRDDQGYWQQVEQYMKEHTDVEFTHGICPDCAQKLYPDFYNKE